MKEHLLPSRAKAPRTESDALDHEEQMRRLHIKAPPEFVKFFPMVSHCYFKWAPKNYRVTVEFVQKERFLNNNPESCNTVFLGTVYSVQIWWLIFFLHASFNSKQKTAHLAAKVWDMRREPGRRGGTKTQRIQTKLWLVR